ncbi:MAG: hypothetical protein C0598_05750 [Marinilabiliales bacterium]|nr:MAG: hypothetical protein C0598_05750 [Marinilabiliales bacterium]
MQINAGTSLFFGDVKQYQWWPVTNYENEWRGGVSLQLNRQLSPVFGIRGQGLYGKLGGTRRAWNKYFDNSYYEFNINTTVNINNIFSRYKQKRFLNAYLIVGLGLLNYNTYVYQLGTKTKIQTVGGGNGKGFGGRTLEGSFHGGLGLDIRINDQLSVNLESANRIMNSDMLDGHVSGFKYDVFNYTAVGLAYKFAYKKNKGPETKKSTITPENKPKNKNYNKRNPGEVQVVEYDYGASNTSKSKDVSPSQKNKNDNLIIVPPIVETEVIVEKPETDDVIIISGELENSKAFEYRVQILAKYGKTMELNKISNMYNIPASQIRQDSHNSYYIYTVGSYATYEQARQKRNQLRNQNGISDAFVVAFKNGKRLNKLP